MSKMQQLSLYQFLLIFNNNRILLLRLFGQFWSLYRYSTITCRTNIFLMKKMDIYLWALQTQPVPSRNNKSPVHCRVNSILFNECIMDTILHDDVYNTSASECCKIECNIVIIHELNTILYLQLQTKSWNLILEFLN